ncbi:MAG TPA: hypothetical protein VGA08_02355 [Candidatus Saccharimonadales bacterium]
MTAEHDPTELEPFGITHEAQNILDYEFGTVGRPSGIYDLASYQPHEVDTNLRRLKRVFGDSRNQQVIAGLAVGIIERNQNGLPPDISGRLNAARIRSLTVLADTLVRSVGEVKAMALLTADNDTPACLAETVMDLQAVETAAGRHVLDTGDLSVPEYQLAMKRRFETILASVEADARPAHNWFASSY